MATIDGAVMSSVYCLALDTTSTDGVDYNSREGSLQRSAVVVQVAR